MDHYFFFQTLYTLHVLIYALPDLDHLAVCRFQIAATGELQCALWRTNCATSAQ